MAERRMFTNKITESDAFLEMPLSSQSLYFHLCMNADDDGFVKNPKRICRMVGCNDDDLTILIAKSFILVYDNTGVIVIKHWRMHNLLRKDRYKPTEYLEERSMLFLKDNGAYTFDKGKGKPILDGLTDFGNQMATTCKPNGNQMAPQDRIGKDSIGKVNTVNESISTTESKNIDSYCPEPTASEQPYLKLLLKDGSEYEVPRCDVADYIRRYPYVDVEQDLRNMQGWLLANPDRRKTLKGIKRFIENWLRHSSDHITQKKQRGKAITDGVKEFLKDE